MKIIPPENLLNAYAQGIFPMADSKEASGVNWYSATKRGVIPLENFHISKNVARVIRQGKFSVKVDTCFRQVIQACADRDSTWINELIVNSYEILHQAGHAHSVEIFDGNELVGGLYGVHLQSAFFGESMFRTKAGADKVALFYCHQILQKNGFTLWDTQFYTEHLGGFGCVEVGAEEYETLLDKALDKQAKFRM